MPKLKQVLGLAVLLVLLVFAYLAGTSSLGRGLVHRGPDGLSIRLRFPRILPTDVGAPVLFSGVVIGRVSEKPYIDKTDVVVPLFIDAEHWSRLNQSSAFLLVTRNFLTQEQVIEAATPKPDAAALEPNCERGGKLHAPLRDVFATIPRQFEMKHSFFDNALPSVPVSREPRALIAGIRIISLKVNQKDANREDWDNEPGFAEPDAYLVVKKHGVVFARSTTLEDTLAPLPESLTFSTPIDVADGQPLSIEVWDDDFMLQDDPIAHFVLGPEEQATLAHADSDIALFGGCVIEMTIRGITTSEPHSSTARTLAPDHLTR